MPAQDRRSFFSALMGDGLWNPSLAAAVVLSAYGVLLLFLLPVQSLWLDELMEVVATRDLPVKDVVLGYAAHSAGQSPLGAVEQAVAIGILGFSAFAARLPAAIAGIVGVAGMWMLMRKAAFQHPAARLFAVAFFASTSTAVRYATEARPYSQALCVSVWLTVLLFELLETERPRPWVMYCALLAFGLYTQPYVVFVPLSHACFLLFTGKRKTCLGLLSAIGVAVLLYLPWYLHSRAFWRAEIEAEQLHFHLQPKLALLIPRELLGTGYLGTVLAAALAIYGLKVRPDRRLLWIVSATVPIALALFADTLFDYFFAIRQVIFVLPAVAILAAFGIDALFRRGAQKTAAAAVAVLLALNLGYTVRWFLKPREDWAAAAASLVEAVGDSGCFVAQPADSAKYYEFFKPELRGHFCTHDDIAEKRTVAVATSPYFRNTDAASVDSMLQSLHFSGKGQARSSQPDVRIYVRQTQAR